MIKNKSKYYRIFSIGILVSILVLSGCKQIHRPVNTKKYKEPLIKVNKYLVNKDNESIKSYLKRHNLKMQQTKTGLWYKIIRKGEIQAKSNQIATINYKVKLLTGELCYSSDSLGPKSFKIGQGGVEPGLEEGILMMHEGDKAQFILPPYLAHGLLGDGDKIPARATIIYEVELIRLSF
ncbi:MAG: peptidylprolyl isomerase [Chlorobi bacterium]|nr:peptidylprolyl isomerase [Chlorobiota bacterium]